MADNLGPVLPIGEVVDVHNIALLGILTSSVYNRRNSVSLVLSCVTPDSFDPVRALGSSGIVSWTKYYSGRNDIDQFDDISRWSLLNFGHLAGDDAQGEGNQANGDRRGAGYPASLEQ